jgi:hypothetical protein
MLSNQHLGNPYPPHSPLHGIFHLWKSNARNADRARQAAAHYEAQADFYLDQLIERSLEANSIIEIETTAVEVDHV